MTSRCRANVHALRFTKPIQEVGQKLGTRMREMAKRFIAVHLRVVLFLFIPKFFQDFLFGFKGGTWGHKRTIRPNAKRLRLFVDGKGSNGLGHLCQKNEGSSKRIHGRARRDETREKKQGRRSS
ncbi:hypothetical protein V6N13_073427 [Hibiscus sabdariffa]